MLLSGVIAFGAVIGWLLVTGAGSGPAHWLSRAVMAGAAAGTVLLTVDSQALPSAGAGLALGAGAHLLFRISVRSLTSSAQTPKGDS